MQRPIGECYVSGHDIAPGDPVTSTVGFFFFLTHKFSSERPKRFCCFCISKFPNRLTHSRYPPARPRRRNERAGIFTILQQLCQFVQTSGLSPRSVDVSNSS